MRPRDIYELADALAPFSVSARLVSECGFHDNSGLLVDCGGEVTGVLFSLDLSEGAVEEAKERGANVIFTHHPAIWTDGLRRLDETCGKHVLACARAGISVISAHLNLDAAPRGIDESLMRGLGGEKPLAVMTEVEGGGYGRVYDVKESPLETFVARAKKTFKTERVLSYGGGKVRRVASFCGAGFDDEALGFALACGADTLVSSDAAHHRILGATECGLNLVLLTHYASEQYGFRLFAERMKKSIGKACYLREDARFL